LAINKHPHWHYLHSRLREMRIRQHPCQFPLLHSCTVVLCCSCPSASFDLFGY
jgi:hypothetical protein